MPAATLERRADGEAGPQILDPGRFSAPTRRRLSAPALRAFLAISDLWRLTEDQRRLVLGSPARSTYHKWVKTAREHGDVTLDVDVLTRISAVLGIHKALEILHENESDGVAWLRGLHQSIVFGGHAPLDVVTGGTLDGLMTVRRFLDAARGGLYMAPNKADADFRPYTDADIVMS